MTVLPRSLQSSEVMGSVVDRAESAMSSEVPEATSYRHKLPSAEARKTDPLSALQTTPLDGEGKWLVGPAVVGGCLRVEFSRIVRALVVIIAAMFHMQLTAKSSPRRRADGGAARIGRDVVVVVRIEKLILGLTSACLTRPVASRVGRDRVLAFRLLRLGHKCADTGNN